MADLKTYLTRLKGRGLSPERETRLLRELHDKRMHDLAEGVGGDVYPDLSGSCSALEAPSPEGSYTMRIRSIDELLERDKMREKDGFPRKIRVGKLVKPARGGKEKFVVVPTTVEEKFIHDRITMPTGEGQPTGGTGDGEEGEVIGEQPVRPEQGAGEGGAGGGEGESHEMESSAYDLGKILTEKFALPNLKDKGKKSSLTRYTYDLTDINRGFGQLLDKKASLRRILETNISLGNVPDITDVDTTRLLISPKDKVYRILSREIDYESQALVFFVRDYSGSMQGKATELVASQHVMIYSWLLYQYARQVESRFILHDNDAKEVPDFYSYYNLQVAGGTKVASAYRLVNEIVEKESLAKDYNIYVFHGTDGDDWDSDGVEAIPELKKMLTYSNRIGITIAEHGYSESRNTEVERYLNKSELLKEMPGLIRLDVMGEDAEESRLIEGIKRLIS
jgi:uncharacterized protein